MSASEKLLEMRGITKKFPGVVALNNVHFDLSAKEVHVLLGENGAGKSTLMKILAGAYHPDAGEIFINGEKVTIHGPKQGQELGVGIIYQEFNLIPYLTVAENIFIENLPRNRLGFIDHKKMHREAAQILENLNMKVDTRAMVSGISTAQQQMVEVAKAMKNESKILIMDEPTASLSERETEQLFVIIRGLKARKIGIVYISHRMQELWEIGDRITVLRDGQYIATKDLEDVTPEGLITMMVGRKASILFNREYQDPGEEALRIEHLYSGQKNIADINLNLHRNEIVGLAGLVGSGRTELARAIFGADSFVSGKIFLFGEEIKDFDTVKMVNRGLAFLPEDRKSQGLALIHTVAENIVIASLDRLFPRKYIGKIKEKEIVAKYIKSLRIITPNMNKQVQYLSGGNQQKVVLAKWLCTDADIFIFDEPTRGIDVNAKAEIHEFMNNLVKNGAAILMISSDLPEITGMSDRIYVMSEGKIAAELNHAEATQEKIIAYATTVDVQSTGEKAQ
jgi:ribose transport system ATP-binding protein